MSRWKELDIGNKLELCFRLVRWPFTLIVAGVFLAKNMESFITTWLLWLFLAWGLIWLIGGTYIDVRETLRVLERKKEEKRLKRKIWPLYGILLLATFAFTAAINASLGYWLEESGLITRWLVFTLLIIVGLVASVFAIRIAKKNSNKKRASKPPLLKTLP